jgi:hypothetical protein
MGSSRRKKNMKLNLTLTKKYEGNYIFKDESGGERLALCASRVEDYFGDCPENIEITFHKTPPEEKHVKCEAYTMGVCLNGIGVPSYSWLNEMLWLYGENGTAYLSAEKL